jgi:cell wall-associated NlpC family hydrolase
MDRGGTGLRRRLRALVVLAAAGLAIVPQGGAHATGGGATWDITAGEAGSGPAPFPISVTQTRMRGATFKWSDVDASDAWAKKAIDYVGKTKDWMRDFAPGVDGRVPFKPDTLETRKYFARAVVKAFAPREAVDGAISFPDLEPSQTFYRWANVAVKLGWMRRTSDGRFAPDKPVSMATVHRVLVLALGMKDTARQLDDLHTRDGVRFDTPANFGALMLGMRLGLRYNSSIEANDVGPSSPMPRSQVAFSLYKAKNLESWVVPYVADQYHGIVLPKMGPSRQAIVRWGANYIGYPYVWGGEWGFKTPEPSALGGQPIPGFDCSGFSWWNLRANDGGAWSIAPPRPYGGWALPQRGSADMADVGRLKYDQLLPGDLVFYDGNDDGTVDHVDIYIGNGYALDSSSTPGGVTVMWVGDGWYRDHFVHGRRVLPTK